MYTEENNNGIYIEKQVRVPTFTMSYEHFHVYCEIFYLKSGSCIYSVNNNLYHLTAGDIFIVTPGDSHCTRYEGLVSCERVVVYCRLDIIPDFFWQQHPDLRKSLARSGKVVMVKKGQIQTESLLCRMLEENHVLDEYSYEFLKLLAVELMLCLKRYGIFVYEQIKQDNGISTDIEDALRYIAQNYMLPLTLEDVAAKINLTPTYLSRKFKKITGVAFKEYVNYIRIRQASQALLTTDDSITKIALNCGFNSSNYFKDLFRRINGISPRTYRRQSASHSFKHDTSEPAASLPDWEEAFEDEHSKERKLLRRKFFMIYNIMDYGAMGNGTTNDARAIQAAIDACSANGGGRVLFPGGRTYISGSLILRSYIELHFEMGSVLKGSDCLEDYDLFGTGATTPAKILTPTYENCAYSGTPDLFFLYAKDCEHLSITGFGKIDGNEKIFYGSITPWHIDGSFYPRVPLLFLENISHLTLLHVTLTGSAFWTTHMVGCRDVLIDGIRILNNLRLANCDGIDPDHCQNMRITNCHIETADDCIVFKNTEDAMSYGPCENITVSGCTLISTSAAIKFGTESAAPFRNITVQNCNISRSNRGISLMLRDGGHMEDITFQNLNIDTRMFSKEHWWGEAEPISITAVKRKEDTNIGYIRGIRFQNINCTGENGILIYGDISHNIQDISFEHIKIQLVKRTNWPKNYHDLRPCEGNDILSGSLNAIYARHADSVRVTDLSLIVDPEMEEYMEQAFDIEECENFVITP